MSNWEKSETKKSLKRERGRNKRKSEKGEKNERMG